MAALDDVGGGGYWLVVILLCTVGVVGLFSFGAPLLLLGLALAAVSPWRTNRSAVSGAVVAVVAFVVVYVLLAPMGCTATATVTSAAGTGTGTVGRTVCANAVGIDYSGSTPYQPNLLPALAAAAVAAAASALCTIAVAGRRSRARG